MIAIPPAGLRDACDDVVDELLANFGTRCDRKSAAVDVVEVARSLGVEVVVDSARVGRARVRRLADRSMLVVKANQSRERLHWTVAHEIGERLVSRVIARLERGTENDGIASAERVGGRLREEIATEFAGRLILPRKPFLAAVDEFDGDLFAIKRRFPNASYELILLGLLRWPDWSVVSILADGLAIRRFGSRGQAPKLSPLEHEAWRACHHSSRSVDFVDDGLRVQVWAIDEQGDQRELMRTTRDESAHSRPRRERKGHEHQFELFAFERPDDVATALFSTAH